MDNGMEVYKIVCNWRCTTEDGGNYDQHTVGLYNCTRIDIHHIPPRLRPIAVSKDGVITHAPESTSLVNETAIIHFDNGETLHQTNINGVYTRPITK